MQIQNQFEMSLNREANQPSLRKAAEQFEALLITQLLRCGRGDGAEGWLGSGGDQSATSIVEMAEEHFAAVLAASGGMGLARMVVESTRATEPVDHAVQTDNP